jgi:Alpha/beta hydrolase domain
MQDAPRVARRHAVLFAIVAASVGIALVTARTAPASPVREAAVPVPTVTGPIPSTATPGDPSHDYVFYATTWPLKKQGYVEQEFFVSGTATRYPNPPTGQDPLTDATPIGTMPYTTRIVVRKPANPKRFKGVVVVDWENVTAGHDIDTEWSANGDFFMRSGWAEIAASTQRIGVHGFDPPNPLAGGGLKQWNPTRYAPLDLTNHGTVLDDSQSFDVYSQIGQLAKSRSGPFKGYKVQHVYAAGVSQSSRYLSVYYNTVQDQANVYDGFVPGLAGLRVRTDVPTKFLRVNTETDVWRGQADPAIRNPDSQFVHIWDIAGASHVPASAISQTPGDPRSNLGWIQSRDLGPQTPVQCVNPYASDVPVWAVFHAAYSALNRWVTKNVPPPTAPPIQASGPSTTIPGTWNIVRDANGFAVGGIRTPTVSVPIALNNGENLPANLSNPLNGFCVLYGTHRPFDDATLKQLYASHGAYVKKVTQAANALVKQRFLLKPDAQTLIRAAAQSSVGK